MKKVVSMLMVLIVAFPVGAFAKDMSASEVVDPHKEWNINFSTEMDIETINKDTITVEDFQGNEYDLNIELSEDKTTITVDSKTPYEIGAYRLHISDEVKSERGVNLEEEVNFYFTVKNKEFIE